MKEFTFHVKGMHCDACVKLLKLKIGRIEGVTEFMVESTGQARVVSLRTLTPHDIQFALQGTEYVVEEWTEKS